MDIGSNSPCKTVQKIFANRYAEPQDAICGRAVEPAAVTTARGSIYSTSAPYHIAAGADDDTKR